MRIARQYEQDMAEASRYYKSQNLGARMLRNGLNVDARDFIPMVALMGIKGSTQAERAADIHEKMDELAQAFEDPDHKKRNDYLDLIYYLVDDFGSTFDPAAMNMSDPVQVEKLLKSMLIDQTIATKKLENPEYYNKRYPTPASRNLVDAHDSYRMAVASSVTTNLYKNDIDIYIVLSLPKPYPEEVREIQQLREQYERDKLDKAIHRKGDLPQEKTVDFPILDSIIPSCGKNVADIPKFSKEAYEQVKNYYICLIENTLLQKGTKNTQGIKEAALKIEEAIYIDGRPLGDFLKDRYPKGNSTILPSVVVCTSILGGKHKVDIVNAYRDEAGQMQYEARTVRAAVTPEQETLYLQQFSRLRRTLFNWGPFRIKPLQERMDRIAKDPKTDERLASVIADHKARIETGIARVKEAQQTNKQNIKKREQFEVTYNDAKKQLEDTTAQWEKDSVIGILGQQITATYVVNGTERTGACDAIRKMIAVTSPEGYENMAPLFSRILLYTQLCSERSANGGQPGELEKLLITGGTIRENIDNTVRQLVNDPVFQDVVLKKIGDENNGRIIPSRSKFERLLISGGYNGLWLEYKQNLKAVGKQNEQSLPKEAQPENKNRKQQDIQKLPM